MVSVPYGHPNKTDGGTVPISLEIIHRQSIPRDYRAPDELCEDTEILFDSCHCLDDPYRDDENDAKDQATEDHPWRGEGRPADHTSDAAYHSQHEYDDEPPLGHCMNTRLAHLDPQL